MSRAAGRALVGFLVRDLRLAAAHRLSFAFGLVGGLFTLTVLYFLSRTVGENALLRSRYGADYFSFALVGVTVALLVRTVTGGLSKRLREAQVDGSLEALMASPHSTLRLLSLMCAYPVLSAALRAAGMLVVGDLVFGGQLEVSFGRLAIAATLTLTAFAALGLISAAVVLVFKRGDPLAFLLDSATYLLSGVMYPVDVLPGPLRWASQLLPATHALSAVRASTLGGEASRGFADGLWGLALWCAVSWPCAAAALVWARRHVERSGTLSHP